MLSAITLEGAQATFDALVAGALDFLPKNRNFAIKGVVNDSADIIKKIKAIAGCRVIQKKRVNKYQLVLIGSSTGGPVALQTIMRGLPADFPSPIVIIQHMPENFTKAFAERINSICNLNVKEASNGDIVQAGHVYVAPGGKQLTFKKQGRSSINIKIDESDNSLYYRPCVDVTFNSACDVC